MMVMDYPCGCQVEIKWIVDSYHFRLVKNCGSVPPELYQQFTDSGYPTKETAEDGVYWSVIYDHDDGSWYDDEEKVFNGSEDEPENYGVIMDIPF